MDKGSLRSFILGIVKPLMSGRIVSQSGQNAAMDNLYPEGADNNFRLASPFGFIAKIPQGVGAFYNSLWGSGYENIIINQIHAARPEPSATGEVLIYSTDASGASVKVKITLKNDGSLNIDTQAQVTITSTAKVSVVSDNIELGSGAIEKVLNGETFQAFFNQHTHIGNLGYPTSAPSVLSDPSHLSSVVKAKK